MLRKRRQKPNGQGETQTTEAQTQVLYLDVLYKQENTQIRENRVNKHATMTERQTQEPTATVTDTKEEEAIKKLKHRKALGKA